jgi:hypothetical protein
MILKNFKKYLIVFLGISLFFVKTTYAICPICTVAVGAGVGLAKYLGIDDTITGLWIGALIISLSMWTINWFIKKNRNKKWVPIATYIGYYIIIIVPLFFMKSVFHPFNTLWGINKLILGIIIGSMIFYIDAYWYESMKRKNGKAHFTFEKVVIPIASLLIASLAFYLITKY